MPILLNNTTSVGRLAHMRIWLYDLATIVFVAVMLEEFLHLCLAQSEAVFGWPFWVGLLGVILFANGLPIATTHLAWNEIYNPSVNEPLQDCLSSVVFVALVVGIAIILFVLYAMYIAASAILIVAILLAMGWWSFLEALVALSYLWLFGAGFYLGPSLLFLAALLRIYEDYS